MIDYKTYTLGNGLRVIHNYDPATMMAAVDVMYATGARDEAPSLTGIAHLFEHLMFGGSVNVPEFDTELENAGGQSNAWTSNDYTNFFEVLPAANFSTALHLESDRLLSLSFNPEALRVQRSVVLEEFKQQCLNQPYGDLMHALRPALYGDGHPYSWPVIGREPAHVEAVTDDDVRRWFHAHYAPNNAVLAISGNIDYEAGRAAVEHWFGDIPSRPVASRQMPRPAFPTQWVDVEMSGNVPYTMVLLALPMAGYGTEAYRAADCITDILSAGRASRLYTNLVARGDGSILGVDASVSGADGPGFLMLSARITDEADPMAVGGMLLDQLAALGRPGNLTDHELRRTLNRFESTFAFQNLDALSKAQNLATALMHGEDINQTVALQRALTPEVIAEEAKRLADTPGVRLIYRKN